ncbi:MAG: hypothetical protein ACLP66_15345 [Polyangia bacterium]
MTVIREVSGHRGYRSHPREVIAEIRDNGQLDWSHFFVVEEGNDVTPPLSNRRLDSTIFFRQVYAFLIVHLASRRVVHVAASRNPTQEWTAQQLRNATMSPLDDDRVDGFAHVGICQQVTQPSWGLFSQLAARQWAATPATPATLPGLTTLRPCQIHWAARVDPICDLTEE